MRKVVYIAHPLSGPDREKNIRNAMLWCAWAAKVMGVSPVATWIVLANVWTEDDREIGLACDVAAIGRCDEIWLVGGRVSEGMRIEKEAAEVARVNVVDLTHLGREVPSQAVCLPRDPVHALREAERDELGRWDIPGWYFWDETWSNRHGPFATRAEAVEARENYARAP